MAKEKVKNIQGIPTWGYCPKCNATISQSSCPVGCKWCLQELDWEEENDSNG